MRPANLVLGGGTLQYTGATVATDRNYTLTAGTTSSIDVANAATNLTRGRRQHGNHRRIDQAR